MKITTFHSMMNSILRGFLCFTFIMECVVITILNMILSIILLLYDFVEFISFGYHLYQR